MTLTELGRGLLDLLATVYAWSDEHGEELLDAYDPDDDVDGRGRRS